MKDARPLEPWQSSLEGRVFSTPQEAADYWLKIYERSICVSEVEGEDWLMWCNVANLAIKLYEQVRL